MILYERVPSLLHECTISANREDLLTLPRLVLTTCGFKDTDISETFEAKQYFLKVFSEDNDQIKALKKIFKKLNLPGIKLANKSLKSKDWLTRWKKEWKPLSLTKKIEVVPFWYKDKHKSSKAIIYLDTLMSFGTGLHETTQLISQLIEDNSKKLGSFLDIGTGTGILTLVALKAGATKALAMDISPLSVEAAKKNLKVNGLKAKIMLGDVTRWPTGVKYDTVAANLITDDLLKNRERIINTVKPGGLLLISGISLENLPRIKKGFKLSSLTGQKISQGKQWAAILYVKKM